MEAEIDLRPYLASLLRNWMWIVGAALLAALTAYGVAALIPPTYEATALVVFTQPQQVVQFDPRFEALQNVSQPLKAYPELATSDELLQQLLAQIKPPLQDITTLQIVRELVEAESGTDPSLVRLSVRYGDAGEAARIVNLWAKLFVTRANEIYSGLGDQQVLFFEEQLEQARIELETAEQALIDFQSHNRATIIDNHLFSLNQAQVSYLADQRAIAFLVQDIQGLRDQLAKQLEGSPITLADELTALFLQIKAFNAQTSIPLQLQISAADSLTNQGRSEQVAFLDGLMFTIEAKSVEIDQKLGELEPQILDLQRQKQEIAAESARLVRNRDVVQETYTALARKVEEERITSQDTTNGVRLASQAAVPEKPASPRKLFTAVTAGTLGLILSASIVSGNAWWHSNEVSLRENRRGPIKVNNDLPDDLGGWLAGSEHDLAYAQPISKESD